MFESVLRNLLSNAIKFTPNKGLVKFFAKRDNDLCVIEISDNGIGMTMEQLDNLFSLEHSISSVGTNNEQGTGIGLILCKDMIDKNRGHIEVKSIPAKGTQFTIKLPGGFSYN
jgi:signal transduction histidine kinase